MRLLNFEVGQRWHRLAGLLAIAISAGISGIACNGNQTHVGTYEEHLFPDGERLQCLSWDDGDLGGHVMRCSLQDLEGRFNDRSIENFSPLPEEGPRSLAEAKRVELFHSGPSAVLLLNNNVFSTWEDVPGMPADDFPGLPKLRSRWYRWKASDDKEASHFLNFIRHEVPDANQQEDIVEVDLAQRTLVATRKKSTSPATRMVYKRRPLNSNWAFDVDRTLSANRDLRLPRIPGDLLFEIKVVETKDGKRLVRYQGTVQASQEWQKLLADVNLVSGETWTLDYGFRALYWESDQLTFHLKVRQHEVYPLFARIGEWRNQGMYSDLSNPFEGISPYVRLIHVGQVSTYAELPPAKTEPLPLDVN